MLPCVSPSVDRERFEVGFDSLIFFCFLAAFLSFSMQLAIQVKTMDMSMPSSYDAIAGTKSTGASLLKEIERTGTMPTIKVQREGEGPSLVSTVLPSMNKSTKKAPKAAKVQVEKEDKKFEKIDIVDMDMPSYSAPAKVKSAFSL